MQTQDLTVEIGQRFGHLVILAKAEPRRGYRCYKAQCDCGHVLLVAKYNLANGQRGCNCGLSLQSHGHALPQSRTYIVWAAMKQRCQNPTNPNYHHYGGRGIRICERWQKFENFLADMGERPQGLTIDRIDNDGDYTPENCRWVSMLIQGRNRRNSLRATHQGENLSLTEWAQRLSLDYDSLRKHIGRGRSFQEAILVAKPTNAGRAHLLIHDESERRGKK